MKRYYILMLQEYTDNQLTDNFYVKDSTYPGTLTFEDYESALKASKTFNTSYSNVILRCLVVLCRRPR